MTSPYINTILETNITINPNQMDNSIYKNIKENLIKKLEKRCYKDYGYISKIYEINKMSNSLINPDIPKASSTVNVTFSCRLCNPLKRKQLICKIEKINHMLINAQNGPITVIITTGSLDSNIFYQDIKENKLMGKCDGKNIEITQGTFVKVTILSKTFNNKDNVILTTGSLDEIVTDDNEIQKLYSDEFNYNDNYIKISEYKE